ncbi:MAG: 2-oxoacid:acceptor oxidoreductase subunit alpha [Firmicutes bacterium]|nr:2-oxoacid:acceptor oxidoreductase subunit alpha [Bacillota bacterium]
MRAVRDGARLVQGSEACVRGALAAGLGFFAGYPITPSTEIAEILSQRLPETGGVFIQMEDEIASICAVIGASLAGKKAMTATSGPGFSLKQEGIGYACIAEVPCVIVNVQRMGPGTGVPTAPAQGDVMQARWGTHGDHSLVVMSPSSVSETYELTLASFDISEELRVPVILLMDEVIAHMRERTVLPGEPPLALKSRKRPEVPPESFKPYDTSFGDVPPMASFGDGYRWHVDGLIHDETGFPTEARATTEQLVKRLASKVESRSESLARFEEMELDDAEVAVVAYGCSARAAREAVRLARQEGYRAGLFRPITLWPFPEGRVRRMAERTGHIIVAEMNLGQLALEVERAVSGRSTVTRVNRVDAELITPHQILSSIQGVYSCRS